MKIFPLDILSTFFKKRFSTILSPIAAKLANFSLPQSVFSLTFETAQVTPQINSTVINLSIIDRYPIY